VAGVSGHKIIWRRGSRAHAPRRSSAVSPGLPLNPLPTQGLRPGLNYAAPAGLVWGAHHDPDLPCHGVRNLSDTFSGGVPNLSGLLSR
jgi:hypothetical protein